MLYVERKSGNKFCNLFHLSQILAEFLFFRNWQFKTDNAKDIVTIANNFVKFV